MTREAMIVFMGENPNVKITHSLFSPEEYIYQKEDGNVYDENGYLFDDWYSDRNNGVRMRTGGIWEDGWSVKFDEETCKLKSPLRKSRILSTSHIYFTNPMRKAPRFSHGGVSNNKEKIRRKRYEKNI